MVRVELVGWFRWSGRWKNIHRCVIRHRRTPRTSTSHGLRSKEGGVLTTEPR